MSHRRSKEAYKKRRQKWEEKQAYFDKVQSIVFAFSFHDFIRAEIVYWKDGEGRIAVICQKVFGYVPCFATNHAFGEVLISTERR